MAEDKSPFRIVLDEPHDEAYIFFSDEQQSRERGATYLVIAHDRQAPLPDDDSIAVNVAFEDSERLLWIKVTSASRALPKALLATAERK